MRSRMVTETMLKNMKGKLSKREFTREEDIVNSLTGIFDVSIAIAYGEGVEQSFFRLLKEIL
ncbi:hypothetical protein BJ912DRAFT_1140771, partial [Pholiota molesta]